MDESAATLERLLQRETDLRREERFAWIFVVTMLIDVIAFERLGASIIMLFLLELIFLGFDWTRSRNRRRRSAISSARYAGDSPAYRLTT
jgi:hypothetical protein